MLEISHTQLELTAKSPHVACVLNVTPNHLDRYSWPRATSTSSATSCAIRPTTTRGARLRQRGVAIDGGDGRAHRSSSSATAPTSRVTAALLRDDMIVWRAAGRDTPILSVAEIPLRGRHNVSNVLAATAVASICGIAADAIATAVRRFQAVPHRLEFVAHVDGVDYYNDSIATTPERTLAGMRSFEEPTGACCWEVARSIYRSTRCFAKICRRCRALVFFGEARETLVAAARAACDNVAPEKRPHLRDVDDSP